MFGNINRFWEYRSRLNGKIYLIHGNHDYKLMCEGNIEEGFEQVGDGGTVAIYKNYIIRRYIRGITIFI